MLISLKVRRIQDQIGKWCLHPFTKQKIKKENTKSLDWEAEGEVCGWPETLVPLGIEVWGCKGQTTSYWSCRNQRCVKAGIARTVGAVKTGLGEFRRGWFREIGASWLMCWRDGGASGRDGEGAVGVVRKEGVLNEGTENGYWRPEWAQECRSGVG